MKFKETLNKKGMNLFEKRKELINKDLENFDEFDFELMKEIAEDEEA